MRIIGVYTRTIIQLYRVIFITTRYYYLLLLLWAAGDMNLFCAVAVKSDDFLSVCGGR